MVLITVKSIGENKCRIVEGELRSRELKNYLDVLGLPKCVWICEDASGIVAGVKHDPSTNQLVGLVLPLDSNTGIPRDHSFVTKFHQK